MLGGMVLVKEIIPEFGSIWNKFSAFWCLAKQDKKNTKEYMNKYGALFRFFHSWILNSVFQGQHKNNNF